MTEQLKKNIAPPTGRAPFILSLICALADGLKQMEKPHSARANRLTRVEETAFRAIEFYPPAELTPAVMDLATEFFEKVEAQFNQVVETPAPVAENKKGEK